MTIAGTVDSETVFAFSLGPNRESPALPGDKKGQPEPGQHTDETGIDQPDAGIILD